MSKDLVALDFDQLPSTQIGDDSAFADLAKGADYLNRLQLFSKGKPVQKGQIPPGHYGIPKSKDEIVDLGESVDVLVLARRPQAMDLSDRDAIVTSYDPTSDAFNEIKEKAGQKDSNCLYGPCFLIFERSTGRFLEFFCGGNSARVAAGEIYPYLPLTKQDIERRKLDVEPHGPIPMTLKCRFVEKGDWSWHVPVVQKCSVPFKNLPAKEEMIKQIARFLNPKDNAVEKVTEKSGRAR